jgi:indole-3-glycerol phosphate synthase
MNILEEIVAKKKIEVAEKKSQLQLSALKLLNPDFGRNCYSLRQALSFADTPNIIAEFKRKSPSRGWINEHAAIAQVVPVYASRGATAISVLTDFEYFGGCIEELITARELVDIPLLRKDFIVDEYQLHEAKAYGADVILLIAACLTRERVKALGACAKELGLEVLLEIHNERELDHICDVVDIIGVNTRNLETFKTDINTSVRLQKYLPLDRPFISESGIDSPATIFSLRDIGFTGFLIGERFMKQPDPAIAFADFMDALQRDNN